MVARDHAGDVEFRFFSPGARQVYLVGNFEGDHEASVPMTRASNGEWVCRMHLDEGVYQFQYLADGRWCIDDRSSGIGWAPFEWNSVTVVRECGTPAFPVG